jgi:hypothetical protein
MVILFQEALFFVELLSCVIVGKLMFKCLLMFIIILHG